MIAYTAVDRRRPPTFAARTLRALRSGGMAAGAMVMNAAIAGPALLATGFVIGKQAAKATTKAVEAEAAVDVAIADLDLFDENLAAVVKRCDELSGILDDLTAEEYAVINHQHVLGEAAPIVLILCRMVQGLYLYPGRREILRPEYRRGDMGL